MSWGVFRWQVKASTARCGPGQHHNPPFLWADVSWHQLTIILTDLHVQYIDIVLTYDKLTYYATISVLKEPPSYTNSDGRTSMASVPQQLKVL